MFFILLLSLQAFSAEPANITAAKVEKLVGKAFLGKIELHEGDSISKSGELITGEKSFLRLFVDKWKSSIIVGPNAHMDLDLTTPSEANPKRYNLREGFCRWVSGMKAEQKKGSHLYTKSAAMGVRGTDFEISNREKTGETEIIVYEGEVAFSSQLAKSEVLLHKGQWGGVGGKFGPQISKIKDLSEKDLEEAKKRTDFLLKKN